MGFYLQALLTASEGSLSSRLSSSLRARTTGEFLVPRRIECRFSLRFPFLLTPTPTLTFVFRSNIHIWAFSGETISILTGHSSFIYSLCLLPDGDLASSGEDHSVRVWRDGKQIQTIFHPAISVWSVAALPNGDLITGASDHQARIFSRDKARLADPEMLQAYEEAVADAVKSPPAAVDMRGSCELAWKLR